MSEKSLIDLTRQVMDLERALIEHDGVLPAELEAQFDLTTGDLKTKVDNYKTVMDAMDARVEYFKNIEQQAKDARKLFENQKNRLKDNMRYSMRSMMAEELLGNSWRFTLRPNADRVEIDEKLLPDMFKKEETVLVPDKDAIQKCVILGAPVPGVTTVQSDTLRCFINSAGKARPVKEIK